MSCIDLVGHVAYVLSIYGTVLIGRGSRSGWGFRIACDVLWIGLGVVIGLSSIIVWSVVFAAADVYCLRRKARGA